MQVVCDSMKIFTNVVAKWPGSVHDSRVFENSKLCQNFQNGQYAGGMLIGDQGYALSRHMLIPFSSATKTRDQNRFNGRHSKTRVVIENAFGMLKRRFPVLHMENRMKAQKVCKVVVACMILHNIAVSVNLPDFDENLDPTDADMGTIHDGPQNPTGEWIRNRITNLFKPA